MRSALGSGTPGWVLYRLAAQAGFDALVARDRLQLDQLVEMFALSRLRAFTVIPWRKAIDDPVREWVTAARRSALVVAPGATLRGPGRAGTTGLR